MAKYIEGLFDGKGVSKKEVRSYVKRENKIKTICYVLITCTEADHDGKMDVKMQYEGKKHLAAYMIETGGTIIRRE